MIIDYEFDYVFIDEAHHIYKPDVYVGLSESFEDEKETYVDLIRNEL